MPKCKCTFVKGTGYLSKECKYHEEHCHHSDCKKKSLKNERYCKEHQEYWDNQFIGTEGYGGSDFS